MINITDKHNCCGCSACVERCPKLCITMFEDEEGFLYPKVDEGKCIDCGLCEKVCPVINQLESSKPIEVFAAKNSNEDVRMQSSSGGIFTILAERTIANDGVVFGAKFDDDWNVVHDYADTIEGTTAFRGSKYVQSKIGDNYKKAEEFLKEGREVLFTGTPCQIAGLHRFFRKNYEKLITVDVVCHGVPSPLVWQDYLKSIICSQGVVEKRTVSSSLNEKPVITGVFFRDKATGWKKYGFKIYATSVIKEDKNTDLKSVNANDFVLLHETLDKNTFMQGFLKDLYLRPSCYACPAKAGKSESDITIADFWGIANYYPDLDDDKGCGLILINTEKGRLLYDSLKKQEIKVEYSQALAGNPAIEYSAIEPKQRKEFWNRYKIEGISCILSICTTMQPSIIARLLHLAKRIIKRIIRSL